MPKVLIVAATEPELAGNGGLACGVGPVEAAAATARALAEETWDAVLHVGVAGARGLPLGSLVIGSEAVYCDLAAAVRLVTRAPADARLLAAARATLPAAPVVPIGTSAAVGGVDRSLAVEAMEGFAVLRAAALAGVPAIEVRAVSNEIGEADRARWEIPAAIAELAEAVPLLVAGIGAGLRR